MSAAPKRTWPTLNPISSGESWPREFNLTVGGNHIACNNSAVFWVVVITVGIHAFLMALHVIKLKGDISGLVGASHNVVGRPPYEAITKSIGPGGYDGMFYYAIARNPWKRLDQGIDAAPVRHLRILYSAICWLCSGGNARLLLWVMPAVNLAAIAGLAWLAAGFALRNNMSPRWGIVLPVAVNACIPALRNLTDSVSTLAVFGLMVSWLTNSSWWSLTLWAAAAVFSREQNVAVLLIVLGTSLVSRRPAVAAGMGVTLLFWISWVCLLRKTYGMWPFLPTQGNFGMPLTGLFYGWTHLGGFRDSRRLAIFNASSLAHLVLQMGLALYILWRKSLGVVGLLLLLGLLLAVVAGPEICNDLISYRRVLVWLPLGIWLGSIHCRQSWPMVLLAPAGLWSLAAALRYV
jgi:hypothetical protein